VGNDGALWHTWETNGTWGNFYPRVSQFCVTAGQPRIRVPI